MLVFSNENILPADGWLDNLINPFSDPQVGAVTGLRLPYEMDTEITKDISLDLEERRYNAAKFSAKDLRKISPALPMALRYALITNPRFGPLTGDFKRVLKAGKDCCYTALSQSYELPNPTRVPTDFRRKFSPIAQKLLAKRVKRGTLEKLTEEKPLVFSSEQFAAHLAQRKPLIEEQG